MLLKTWQRLRHWKTTPVLASRAAYAQWADHYPAIAHNAFMELEETTLQAMLPPLAGQVVLDLACGTGRWGKIAQASGAKAILGIDNSIDMLHHAILTHRIQAEMYALPLPAQSMDVVICGLAMGHLPPPLMHQAIQEVSRVLRPHGHFLLSDLHPFQAWQGAQRTFKGQDGKTYAVEHYPHTIADYHQQAHLGGLALCNLCEAPMPAQSSGLPVVLVLHFKKTAIP